MSIPKKVITGLLSFYCLSLACNAQQAYLSPSQELAYHIKSIDTTSYIFEGTVTNQKGYYSRKGEVLTCNTVQIGKIYRGSPKIKLGSIKVITFGGNIGGSDIIAPQITDQGPTSLRKGTTYIIFSKPAYSTMIVDTMAVTDNSIVLTRTDCVAPIIFPPKKYRNGHLIPIDYPAAQWDNTKYKTMDELNSFLKDNGLTVQEEAKQ